MTDEKTFGLSDEEIQQLPTVYKEGLFEDQVVAISGAGGGIGRACSFLFARLGATLELCGRDPEKLEQTAAGVRVHGATVHCTSFNIRNAEQVEEFIAAVWERNGRLDCQINNAGGQFAQEAIEFSLKGWHAVIDTNLNGTWHMMQQAALGWRKHGQRGNIINIVAMVSRGFPGMAHTAAARAGVIHLSKTVAVEWAPMGLRVNCIAPGTIETAAFKQYPPAGQLTFPQSNPMRRAGDVQDIAESCVYLAAPSGKFITGEVLAVDGGQQLWGDPWPIGRPDYFKL